jgi:transposase-like protein
MYLYRAVDERGRTVESHLTRTRDKAAAKAFFRKALKRHGQPRTITLDGFEPTHSALRIMGMRNEFNYRWENPVRIRSLSLLEQHRRAAPPAIPKFACCRCSVSRRSITHADS